MKEPATVNQDARGRTDPDTWLQGATRPWRARPGRRADCRNPNPEMMKQPNVANCTATGLRQKHSFLRMPTRSVVMRHRTCTSEPRVEAAKPWTMAQPNERVDVGPASSSYGHRPGGAPFRDTNVRARSMSSSRPRRRSANALSSTGDFVTPAGSFTEVYHRKLLQRYSRAIPLRIPGYIRQIRLSTAEGSHSPPSNCLLTHITDFLRLKAEEREPRLQTT